MKRIISIVLLLFFLVGNSYAAINVHYCSGKLQNISIITKAKLCGMCSKESSKKGCCRDMQKIIKADDFSKVKFNWSLKTFFVSLIAIVYPAFSITPINCLDSIKCTISGDSPKLKTPTFIRLCSLII